MFLVNCVGAGPWIEGCGNVCIPAEVAKLTTLAYNAIKVIVPIALIIIGMVDMAKAITSKSEDEVKKAQQLLVKKAIAGALVFVLFSAIVWVLTILDATSNHSQGEANVISCMNNLFDFNEGESGGSSTSTIDYVVQSGETLESIARKYNISVTSIRNANRDSIESGEDVVEGQTIRIPVSSRGATQGYTDPNPICQAYGYDGATRVQYGTGYRYHCYKYKRSNYDCDAGYPFDGRKYTLEDGQDHCLKTGVDGNNLTYMYGSDGNILSAPTGNLRCSGITIEDVVDKASCRNYCSSCSSGYFNEGFTATSYVGSGNIVCICIKEQ